MKRAKRQSIFILIFLLAGVFCFSTGMLIHTGISRWKEQSAFDKLSALVAEAAERQQEAPKEPPRQTHDNSQPTQIHTEQSDTEAETTPEPTPLPQYAPLYEQNADFFGWISIEGTNIDYPVMYSPYRPEYYLKRAFDGSYSGSGVPFIDGKCPSDGNYYLERSCGLGNL